LPHRHAAVGIEAGLCDGLSGDPAECINLNASRDDAKLCGIEHVVFILDARVRHRMNVGFYLRRMEVAGPQRMSGNRLLTQVFLRRIRIVNARK